MKHPFDTSKNFFTKIAAHKKKIAVLLIAVMILPYLTQTFLERQEQKREEKAVEEAAQKVVDLQNEALDRFSDYVTQSDYDNGLKEINGLIQMDGSNPQYFLKRAGLYVLLDQRDLALDDLNTTLALSPDLYDALQLRSQIYDEKWEYESAIADYQKMYELDSTQKDVLMYIADCYQQLPDYEKAIEAYDTAAGELPEYASAIAYARGVCYYSTEEFDKAVTDFLDYYSTDPDDGELNFLIGSCYMNLEKETDAKPYLLKALNGTSYLPETNFYLGSISMDEEDYEAAIPYFTAAIEGDCFTDFSSYNRGVCYLHTDQAEEAVSDFQYAVEHTTDPQLLSDSQNILDQITPKS